MGKFGKKRQKKQEQKKANGEPKTSKRGDELGDYAPIVKENKEFETYYKMQQIVPEGEWQEFMDANRSSLPATFRVTGSRAQADALLHLIQNTYLQDLAQVNDSEPKTETTGVQEKEIKIFPLPWYPGNLAWQMNLARTDIRKTEAYVRLHNFLMSETDSGNISRQETVSMIPPVVLQVEPHHKVLDMCAAPGSKTAQILEFLHAGETKIPEGVVIANDVENKRCYMLVHQAKRLQSPALIVTNQDGTDYPDIFVKKDDDLVPLKFDRVLCDVPCSGDGTLRKNLALWKRWHVGNAIQLHGIQHRIAKRGLELLEIGGQLVYSTCSLNPIENEAVVHRLLRDGAGAVELMEIILPGLKSSPGVSTWVPTEKDLTSYANFDSIEDKGKSILREYHYPPSEEDKPKYPLDKCIRILPHLQNTGGFFIALLKKTGVLPWEKTPLPQDRIAIGIPRNKDGKPEKKMYRPQGYREDPYIFMTDDHQQWNPLREFYNLDKSIDASHFLLRSDQGKPRNIYLTTKLLKNIVENNEGYLKIINTGVKAFARCDNPSSSCDYRLASEGIGSMVSIVNSRVAKIPKEDLVTLLLNNDADTPPLIATLSPAAQAAVQDLGRGCFVLIVESSIGENGPTFPMELLGWRGNASIRAYVPLNERVHYLRMCGQDVSRFEKNKYKEDSPAAEAVQEQE